METKSQCTLIWIVLVVSVISAIQVSQDCKTTGFPEVTFDIDNAVYETKTQTSGWRQNISVVVEGGFVNSLLKLTCAKCPHSKDAGIEYVMEESLLETILPDGWVRRPAGKPITMEWYMLPTMRTDRMFLVRCRYIHNASLGVTVTTRFTASNDFTVKIGTDDNATEFLPNYEPEDKCEATFYYEPADTNSKLGFRSYKLFCEMPMECSERRGNISIRMQLENLNKRYSMLDTKLGGKVCWSPWNKSENGSKNSLIVTDLSPKILACSDPDGAVHKPLKIGTFVIFGIPDINTRITPIYFSDDEIDPVSMYSEPEFEITSVVVVAGWPLVVSCNFSKYFCRMDKSNLVMTDHANTTNEIITASSIESIEHLHVFTKTWHVQVKYSLRSLHCKCFPQSGKWKAEQLPVRKVDIEILELLEPELKRVGSEMANFSIGMINRSLECQAVGRPRPIPEWFMFTEKGAVSADKSAVDFRSGSTRNKAGVTWAELKFHRVTYDTRGRYGCRVGDAGNETWLHYQVMVTGPPEIISLRNYTSDIGGRQIHFVRPGTQVYTLTCSVRGDPDPHVHWKRNLENPRAASKQSNGTVSKTEKTNGIFYKHNVLTLHNVSISDAGNYTCIANNEIGSETAVFRLIVASPPKIQIKGPTGSKRLTTKTVVEVQLKRHSVSDQTVECRAAGWPLANVSWEGISGIPNETIVINETLISSRLRFTSIPYGSISKAVCIVTNDLGNDTQQVQFIILGPPEFTSTTDTEKVCDTGVGKNCKIFAWVNGQPQPEIVWTFQGETVSEISKAQVESTIESEKVMYSVTYDDAGIYVCNATNDYGVVAKHIKVTVRGKPEIISTTNQVTLDISDADSKIQCAARGFPDPYIQWLYNNMSTSLEARVDRREKSGVIYVTSTLEIPMVSKRTKGKYKCIARNFMGNATFTVKVEVEDKSWWMQQIGMGIGIPLLIIFFIFVGVFLRYKLWKQRLLIQQLTEADIEKFFRGDPNARKDDFFDAESKGYDDKFEIPRENIELEEFGFPDGTDGPNVLGVGNFGVVKKGVLKGAGTDIAVKTIKSHADAIHFKSLMTEIKVLGYLEGHPNIVSLVGAVTSNLKNRELYAAFEYCQHADLLSFMKKNRRGFKNLLAKSGYRVQFDDCLEICHDYEMGTGSFRASPRSRVRAEKFNTNDLYKWARDVAFGMIYLGIKKVIHGDLAARNILLTENRVAKISDFGLSHQLVKDSSVYARTDVNALIPWRWLPPETIRTMEFSPQTDIWSYGVLLWEIFSLGDVPYPGFEFNDEFLSQLEKGYRLQKPGFADSGSYDIMNECWDSDRSKRPDFETICEHYQYHIQDNGQATNDTEAGATETEESEM